MTQRAILDALHDESLTTAALARVLGRSQVQVRNATDALQRRGLVFVSRGCVGTREDGLPIYGRLVRRTPRTGRLVAVSPQDAVAFVRRWHYSRMAAHGVVRHGWEVDGRLMGVSVYDTGSHAMRLGVFGPEHYRHVLHHHRLALTDDAPRFTASQFLSASLRQLRRERPEVWGVVTYADECEGHRGTIYQATNATYTGRVGAGNLKFRTPDGRLIPTQSVSGTWQERRATARELGWDEARCVGKHRYVYVLGTKRQRASRPPVLWPTAAYPQSGFSQDDSGKVRERL